jgi:hypothetical protein
MKENFYQRLCLFCIQYGCNCKKKLSNFKLSLQTPACTHFFAIKFISFYNGKSSEILYMQVASSCCCVKSNTVNKIYRLWKLKNISPYLHDNFITTAQNSLFCNNNRKVLSSTWPLYGKYFDCVMQWKVHECIQIRLFIVQKWWFLFYCMVECLVFLTLLLCTIMVCELRYIAILFLNGCFVA